VNIKSHVSMWFHPRSHIPSSTTSSTFLWYYVTHGIFQVLWLKVPWAILIIYGIKKVPQAILQVLVQVWVVHIVYNPRVVSQVPQARFDDWCCFYYFVKLGNILAVLLEALWVSAYVWDYCQHGEIKSDLLLISCVYFDWNLKYLLTYFLTGSVFLAFDSNTADETYQSCAGSPVAVVTTAGGTAGRVRVPTAKLLAGILRALSERALAAWMCCLANLLRDLRAPWVEVVRRPCWRKIPGGTRLYQLLHYVAIPQACPHSVHAVSRTIQWLYPHTPASAEDLPSILPVVLSCAAPADCINCGEARLPGQQNKRFCGFYLQDILKGWTTRSNSKNSDIS